VFVFFFFFQAEDGIRDRTVTGVQTCALPIYVVQDGNEFVYEIRGNGFLHHMVRNLVGTFLLVGKGTLRPADVPDILSAKNRSAAGATAPAQGLYLVSVEY